MHTVSHFLVHHATNPTPQLQGQVQGILLFEKQVCCWPCPWVSWFSNITLPPTQFEWHCLNATLTDYIFSTDQIVKYQCNIWYPQDIPATFMMSTCPTLAVPIGKSNKLLISIPHKYSSTHTHYHNHQLLLTISPSESTQSSPPTSPPGFTLIQTLGHNL